MSTPSSWLWPDRVIGKRESRRLREEHNRVVNNHAELLQACQLLLDAYAPNADYSPSHFQDLHSSVRAAHLAIQNAQKV